MTTEDLAAKINLSRRAVVLNGSLIERKKSSQLGSISGYSPHYAISGCPCADYDDQGECLNPKQEGLCIEAKFDESSSAGIGPITSSYAGQSLNMVQLMFGRRGIAPTGGEAAVMLEAGDLMRQMTGKPVHLVALPILTSGNMGIAAGRFYLLGLFRETGEAVWIHPNAEKLGLLKHPMPPHQTKRTTEAKVPVATPASPEPEWYAKYHETFLSKTKLRGLDLHNAIITHYANELLLAGRASTQTDATRLARQEYELYKTGKAAAPAAETARNDAPLPKTAARLSAAKTTSKT